MRSGFAAAAAGLLLLVQAALGSATVVPLNGNLVTVRASAGTRTAEWSWPMPVNLQVNNVYEWSLTGAPLQLISTDSMVLATVNSLSLRYDGDPEVSVAFDVTAGGATTTIDISSAPLGFAPLANPDALAQANAMIVDQNNSGYAKLAGKMQQPWGFSGYQARYNGASAWTDLISELTVISPGGSGETEEGRPDSAPSILREAIPATVSSIESQWMFSVTAGDRASGTSTFSVIPEPSVLFLALAGLVFVKRRR